MLFAKVIIMLWAIAECVCVCVCVCACQFCGRNFELWCAVIAEGPTGLGEAKEIHEPSGTGPSTATRVT